MKTTIARGVPTTTEKIIASGISAAGSSYRLESVELVRGGIVWKNGNSSLLVLIFGERMVRKSF